MKWQYIVGLAIGLVAVVGYLILYYRISKISEGLVGEVRRQCDNVITQVECLININVEISPVRALPRSRGWAASPDFLHQVIDTTRRLKPNVILECSSGLSTVILAGCLRNIGRGHIYSLENDPHYAERTREVLQLQGLDSYVTVVDAPLVDLCIGGWRGRWYDLSNLPVQLAAELLVIDGPPFGSGSPARYPAIPCLGTRLKQNYVVILDDADRAGEKKAVQMWIDEIPGLQLIQSNSCEKGCAVLERRI